MALTLNFTAYQSDDGKSIVFHETTGGASSTTGWGYGTNPATTDIVSAGFNIESDDNEITTIKAQSDGTYKTTFTAPSFSVVTYCKITATFSKTGYMGSQATTQIAVGPTALGNKTSLQFRIVNEAGEPLSNTLVSSTNQPNGMGNIVEIANETGYVRFNNLLAGSYTFKLVKDGYVDFNETLTMKGTPLTLTITMTHSNTLDSQTLALIAIVIIVAAVVAVASGLLIIRRRRSARVRKLQDLQKKLKHKPY